MNEPILKKRNILDRIINNQLVVTVFTAILMVFVIVGSSYAIFTKSSETETNDVVVATGDMEAVISSEDCSINIEYTTSGVTDEVGIQGESYDFTIANTSNSKIAYYELRIVDKEFSESTLPHAALKFSVSYNGGEYTEPQYLGDVDSYVFMGHNLDVGEIDNFSIKLWVSNDRIEFAQNKQMTASLELTLYNELPIRNYIFYDLNGVEKFVPKKSITSPIIDVDINPWFDGSSYELGGWSSDKNAEVPEYYPGDKYDKEEGTILYAVWRMMK